MCADLRADSDKWFPLHVMVDDITSNIEMEAVTVTQRTVDGTSRGGKDGRGGRCASYVSDLICRIEKGASYATIVKTARDAYDGPMKRELTFGFSSAY